VKEKAREGSRALKRRRFLSTKQKKEERNTPMGFNQYNEPANELSPEIRTFARMIASLTEEAEAIGWYEQRLAVEPNAQGEEFKHFGMDLEFLLRQKPKWRVALQDILFKEGNIVEHGEEAEEAEHDAS
jgi:uncharacterized protein